MKYPEDFVNKIICGDCLEVMKDIPDKSVDLVLTDPPYGVSFKKKGEPYIVDYGCPKVRIWNFFRHSKNRAYNREYHDKLLETGNTEWIVILLIGIVIGTLIGALFL